MFETYSVGAIFTIENRATPTLREISRQLETIDTLAASVEKHLRAIGLVRFGSMTRSLDRATTTLTDAATAAAAFATSMGAAATAATATGRAFPTAAAAGAGGRGRAGGIFGGGGGGTHLYASGPVGPLHARAAVGGTLGLAAALGYGAFEEAELRDAAARMMLTAQIPVGPGMSKMDQFQQIRGTILDTMSRTGLPPRDIENAMLSAVRQMGGFEFGQRMGVMPEILQFAATEARLKDVSVAEATQSLIGIIHQTGTYDPDQMKTLASRLAFASTVSPLNLSQIERASSYALPTLKAGLGMDPGALLLLMAQMQSAGVISSKSGTWAQQFFTYLSPKTSLASLISGRGGAARATALRQLGMIGPGGQLVGAHMASEGNFVGIASTIHEHLQKIPQDQRLAVLSQAFGAQGGRFAAMLQTPSFLERMPELQREMETFKAGAPFFQQYSSAVEMQQARETLRDFQAVLMQLGADVLPALTSVLRGVDNTLKAILNLFGLGDGPKGGLTTGDLMKGGGAAGAAIGLVMGGPAGAVVGAGVGAGGGALLGEQLKYDKALKDAGIDTDYEYDVNGRPIVPIWGSSKGTHHTSVTGNTIIVQSATDDPAAHADAIAKGLAEKLSAAHDRNQGTGGGTFASPFASGVGP
jgi:hypothetical protein